MLLVRILILLVLLVIFVQDIKSRSVYWIVFPLLIVLFIISDLIKQKATGDLWLSVLLNLGFLVLQLLIITGWFSLKEKRWLNISANRLGWGDILFLVSISFYLSFVNFLFFHIVSLFAALTGWLIWQFFTNKKSKHVPLAGMQALAFGIFLSGDWWLLHFDMTNDTWLIQLLIK
ncbi:hypothetical protein [Mucilaginibacter sp.]